MKKYYEEKELVEFGNYLLSEERERIILNPENRDAVTHADMENWKEKTKDTAAYVDLEDTDERIARWRRVYVSHARKFQATGVKGMKESLRKKGFDVPEEVLQKIYSELMSTYINFTGLYAHSVEFQVQPKETEWWI